MARRRTAPDPDGYESPESEFILTQEEIEQAVAYAAAAFEVRLDTEVPTHIEIHHRRDLIAYVDLSSLLAAHVRSIADKARNSRKDQIPAEDIAGARHLKQILDVYQHKLDTYLSLYDREYHMAPGDRPTGRANRKIKIIKPTKKE
jgi:hypothetical protein